MPRHSTPHPEPPTLSARPKPASLNQNHSKTSEAHGLTLPAGNRRSHATYYASARSRYRAKCSSGHSFSGPEDRKEPGPRHVARPSEDRPWRGNTQQIQTGRIGKYRGQAGTSCMRRMATKPRHYKRHPKIDPRITLVRCAERHAQRTAKNTPVFGRERKPELPPASSGWTYDPTPRRVLHSSPSRCWWREGELSPSEYGNPGLIYRQDPSLEAQLREDPGSMTSQSTR